MIKNIPRLRTDKRDTNLLRNGSKFAEILATPKQKGYDFKTRINKVMSGWLGGDNWLKVVLTKDPTGDTYVSSCIYMIMILDWL